MKYIDFLVDINKEVDQSKLRQMHKALTERLATLAQIKAATVKVGDTIRFADNIHPTYLRGLSAKVVGLNRKTVKVKCPVNTQYGRFSGANGVRLPMELIAS